ncbi:sugar phosphate isomerase/epimerase family protein [Phytohabitans sp. ZYX-F-186]|uniref:Sugar phosphate isomerase/epimerase family protein n=1 Tax=Phytohabitans maris TaxID=3071409 RepID=A0ABU0ZEW1_9ACTN|nr:sugar phosphate isomerase/epimerase family protein [Phytohabitans sp. ZYX-F-186]MDQ7905599.1 sugar phosphate isomerase/epimerase family protein [Phytohabitans sp. ZYX-F-186]
MKIACLEHLLPGDRLQDKWEFALRVGYDAIELRGRGAYTLRQRLPELRRAVRDGVVLPTVSVDMRHFFGAFDRELRRDAIDQVKSQLSAMADIGGRGVVTPASRGMFSPLLPPFRPPRSAEGDRDVLVEGLTELGRHAEKEGVRLFLEPLNRYEDHMVNRVDHGAELIRAVGTAGLCVGGLGLAVGTFHLNIEEDHPALAIRGAGRLVGHVLAADSNGFQPGAGHLEWSSVLSALSCVGYDGFLTVKCRLRGDEVAAVASVPAFLRSR